MSNWLIVRKESIFTKIKNFFKNLLFKNKESNQNNTDKLLQNNDNQQNVEELKNKQYDYEKTKKDTIKTYRSLLNKEILPNDIPDEQLEKIAILLKEEIKTLDKKINDLKAETSFIKYKINTYENS